METAITYSRCSTREQSNAVQTKQLEDYCRKCNLKINGSFEETISGASTEKEVLDGIISSEPMADVLVIREVSRLSRETDYVNALGKINMLAKKYSIHIVADNHIIKRGEVLSMTDGLILIIKLYSSAEEREKIAMRTSEAKRRYKENPLNNAAGGLAYGLKRVPNPSFVKGVNTKFIYQPDEEKWDTVLEIYRLKAEGLSYTEVALQVGLDKSLVRNIMRNKRIRYFVPSYLWEEADRQSKKLDSSPAPKHHHNPYKNIIFDGDSERAMVHQATSKGFRYFVEGKGSINENDLNKTVYKALTSFVEFFQIKRDDLVSQNAIKVNTLTASIRSLRETFEKKTNEVSTLRQKAVRTDDFGLYEELQKRIVSVQSELDRITRQIQQWEKEIEDLENVEMEDVVITEDNLETYVHRYVKAIRYYPVRTFCRVIRVEIKDEFIPEGYARYKEYEVYRSHSGNYIKALRFSPLDLTPGEQLWYVDIKNGSH